MHGVQKRNLQLEKKTLLLSKQILKFLAIILRLFKMCL